jgi:formiminoglutamate deiminase
MYEVARGLTPERYERIATAVFIEMAMAGITAVGEFHYVHHQTDGRPYESPNEMGHALIRAARTAGIRICLLDAGYFTAGFGNTELSPVQERFRDSSPEAWMSRARELADAYEGSADVRVGLAPHSVRAVPPETLRLVGTEVSADEPLHVHLSEQPAENLECEQATGMTPTALLGESGLLGSAATLVHATHLTSSDIEEIGLSHSRVCYCTTTERDLADGIGPSARLSSAGASMCVGSDSHAVVDLFEEARGIEMHQRLSTGRRGVHSASELVSAMTAGGASSLGLDGGMLEEEAPADFVVVDLDSPRLAGFEMEHGLETIVFAATNADVSDVFVGGRQIIRGGRHHGWDGARPALAPPG